MMERPLVPLPPLLQKLAIIAGPIFFLLFIASFFLPFSGAMSGGIILSIGAYIPGRMEEGIGISTKRIASRNFLPPFNSGMPTTYELSEAEWETLLELLDTWCDNVPQIPTDTNQGYYRLKLGCTPAYKPLVILPTVQAPQIINELFVKTHSPQRPIQ